MKIEETTNLILKPKDCGRCLFYSEVPYRCHNERGNEARCKLGFMDGYDMRDKSYMNSLWEGCKLVQIIIDIEN